MCGRPRDDAALPEELPARLPQEDGAGAGLTSRYDSRRPGRHHLLLPFSDSTVKRSRLRYRDHGSYLFFVVPETVIRSQSSEISVILFI